MLLLVGSLGLIVHAHEAVPDLAALAASCVAFAFLMTPGSQPLKTGAAFGAALGVAFLSTGPVVPAVLGASALLAHFACDEWRTSRAPRFLGAAVLAFAVLAVSWPLALWLRAPELARDWWFGATHARGDFLENLRYYLTTASWFAWPPGRRGRCAGNGARRACSCRSRPHCSACWRSPGPGRSRTST